MNNQNLTSTCAKKLIGLSFFIEWTKTQSESSSRFKENPFVPQICTFLGSWQITTWFHSVPLGFKTMTSTVNTNCLSAHLSVNNSCVSASLSCFYDSILSFHVSHCSHYLHKGMPELQQLDAQQFAFFLFSPWDLKLFHLQGINLLWNSKSWVILAMRKVNAMKEHSVKTKFKTNVSGSMPSGLKAPNLSQRNHYFSSEWDSVHRK